MADHLLPYPLTPKTVHLCVDMQRLFSENGPWPTPWMARVLPVIAQIVQAHPERTVFSRFITPVDAREMPGMWQRYYTRWRIATQACVNPGLLELMPELRRYSPPATAWLSCCRLAAPARLPSQARDRPHRTDRLIRCADRRRRAGASPFWPSDRSACSSGQPASRPWHHTSIGVPGASLARTSATRAGKFF